MSMRPWRLAATFNILCSPSDRGYETICDRAHLGLVAPERDEIL